MVVSVPGSTQPGSRRELRLFGTIPLTWSVLPGPVNSKVFGSVTG